MKKEVNKSRILGMLDDSSLKFNMVEQPLSTVISAESISYKRIHTFDHDVIDANHVNILNITLYHDRIIVNNFKFDGSDGYMHSSEENNDADLQHVESLIKRMGGK